MEFEKHLEKYLSKDDISLLLKALLDKPYHALIINPYKIDKETLLKEYPLLIPHPIIENAFLYDKETYDLGKSLWHELGAFYLQEPSAMLPAYFLDIDKGDIILDMCAAPGGKSIQTSFKIKEEGIIISNDLSSIRQSATLENIERLGLGNIIITSLDFEKHYDKFLNYFSKIILDAPCSGSGMFRKDEKMRDDWNIEKVYKYSGIQKRLINIAYQMLKPGGEMIYSTCSFSYEEDEEVVQYLIDHSDAEVIDLPQNKMFYQSAEKMGIHLFPHLFKGEGHYLIKIKKPGTLINDKKFTKKEIRYGENKFISYLDLLEKKNIYIIRNGIKKSMFKGQYECYEHHYARSVNNFHSVVELDKNETISYINGQQLNHYSKYKGEVLLKYQNMNIDFAKTDGQVIKNRYPKGLRKLIND